MSNLAGGDVNERRVGLALAPNRGSASYANANEVRHLVQTAMREFGLGQTDPKVPLADIIAPGQSVLLKPNWVTHVNKSGATMDCMITHPEFILAVLREVVAARAGRIVIGDAPIQGGDFARLAAPAFRQRATEIAGAIPLEIVDFRNTISTYEGTRMIAQSGMRDASRFIEFNLGTDSILEPVAGEEGQFRCTNYNPDDMAKVQGPGVHRFLLCKEPFEADVIISLPKLKTHAKAGITAALKNLVGMNGDKNYLPHHRVGGSSLGGDCYEGVKPFKRIAERIMDAANRRIGRPGYVTAVHAANIVRRVQGGDLEGKWWGNDTTWRMVLDLNRILLHGDSRGRMYDEPQRRIYSLTDAIIAGERNGPLAPDPISAGAVTFAANSAHADAAHAALMRFDPSHIALIREAFTPMRFPIVTSALDETLVHCEGSSLDLGQIVKRYGVAFRPPDGWVGHVENAFLAHASV